MLDDLRQQADAEFIDENEEERISSAPARTKPTHSNFLGMTPAQRFIIAVMFLGLACLLSVFCLLVTQKVVPPFLF